MTLVTAAEVRGHRFPTTSMREGYEQADVDAFLARAVAALDALEAGATPGLTGREVLEARFSATKFRPGYDQDAVDDLLDRVRVALDLDRTPLSAEEVRRAAGTWRQVRRAPGYEPAAVDTLLERLATDLGLVARGLRPQLTSEDLTPTALPRTWWKPGYRRADVAALLARAQHTLHAAV